ncbi:hypothetical protein AB0M22_05720 [Nocardia sp. NPDC051756]|uniref:hypothetical protein n=1 Tax=Nocardia sp. NPDC051756 TaxID=3154751 RepID=UPI0034308F98
MSAEHRVKYLEMLQTVIARLSQQSFTVRGWSVTLVSIIFAFLTTQDRNTSGLILFTLAPAWLFWGLDAYYLSVERRYRELFAAVARQVREPDRPAPDIFEMLPDSRQPFRRFARAALTPSVAAIPVVLTVLVVGYRIAAIRMR